MENTEFTSAKSRLMWTVAFFAMFIILFFTFSGYGKYVLIPQAQDTFSVMGERAIKTLPKDVQSTARVLLPNLKESNKTSVNRSRKEQLKEAKRTTKKNAKATMKFLNDSIDKLMSDVKH